jgi:glycosyltransferase involved in cell wall biosynthesis
VRVLHVIPSLSPVHGGPTAAMAAIERALTAAGVAVETATTDDDGPGRRRAVPLGVPVRENGVDRWYFAKRAEFYKPSPSLARWLARETARFDLVHLHALFSFSTAAGAWAARRRGVPYVVRPLGTLDPYGLGRRRRLKALSMRWVEAPLLRGAAAVHFTSQAEAQQARSLGIPWREAVIPLAVEPPARTQDDRFAALRGGPCVLFLSRLDPKKNLEALLGAVARLQGEWPGVRLLVAGDGEPAYVERLRGQAGQLGIGPRVTWAGHLDGDAKSAALAAADVFVLPSFTENFGVAAAEALAAGLPCVLSHGVAIAQEVAQAGAGLAVSPDAPALAEALRHIMAPDSPRARMSANARRLAAERYSPAAMGRQLRQLYTDLLAR